MSFKDEIYKVKQEAEAKKPFKVSEGANRVRILQEPIRHDGSYNGRPTVKWLTRVLDRKDGKIKLWFMPSIISMSIGEMMGSDDWGFEEFPMPYDVTINAKDAGKKEVEYTPMPSPKREKVDEDIILQLEGLPKLTYIREKLQENQSEKQPIYERLHEEEPPTLEDY